MSKKTFIIFALLTLSLSGLLWGKRLNTIPMYGGDKITMRQKRKNKIFVKDVIKAAGSKEKALEYTLAKAWELFYKGDLDTSMMRFNQAWLLDPDNVEVYWGFGVISGQKEKMADSIKYLQKALELDPENNRIMVDLAFTFTKLVFLYEGEDSRKVTLLIAANAIFEKAEEIDNTYHPLYNNWAVTLMALGKYREALDKLKYAQSIGFEPNPDFIKELEEKIEEEAEE